MILDWLFLYWQSLVVLLGFFIATLFILYVILNRSHYSWILGLGKKPHGGMFGKFWFLFSNYFPMTLLLTFALINIDIGWTLSLSNRYFMIYYYSAVIILFISRTAFTTSTRVIEFREITGITGFAMIVTSVVGLCKMVYVFIFERSYFYDFLPLQLNFTNYDFLTSILWILSVLVPLILVSSVGELSINLFCKVFNKQRGYHDEEY